MHKVPRPKFLARVEMATTFVPIEKGSRMTAAKKPEQKEERKLSEILEFMPNFLSPSKRDELVARAEALEAQAVSSAKVLVEVVAEMETEQKLFESKPLESSDDVSVRHFFRKYLPKLRSLIPKPAPPTRQKTVHREKEAE